MNILFYYFWNSEILIKIEHFFYYEIQNMAKIFLFIEWSAALCENLHLTKVSYTNADIKDYTVYNNNCNQGTYLRNIFILRL